MIPQSDIAAAARDYCKTWPQDTYHPNDLAMFYEKGANWYRDRVMEMASEGFDDFYRSRESGPRLSYDEVWQAARMSMVKELTEVALKLGEADSEVAHLKDELEEMKKDMGWALNANRAHHNALHGTEEEQKAAQEMRTRWGLYE